MNDYKDYQEEVEPGVQYFCKFTFGQFFTLLVLEVVTLGFVFYLGAKYGNEYIKITKEDSAPQQMITEVVAKGTTPAGNETIKDKELQQMAREAMAGNSEAELKAKVREMLAEKPVENPSPALEPDNRQVVMNQKPANTEQLITPQTETSDGGAVRVKSPSNAQYSIQVGSYPSMDEANSKISDWRSRGYPAFMMIADIPDRGRWYRVRIGGFASKEDAQKYMDRFRSSENTEAIIVLNEQ